MKYLIRLFFLILIALLLYSVFKTDRYHDEYIEIQVVSKLLDCEEQNIFYEIVSVNNETYSMYINTPVLPVCTSVECRDLVYKISPLDTNKTLIFKGWMSKKAHNVKDYGCPTARSFKIDTVVLLNNGVVLGAE